MIRWGVFWIFVDEQPDQFNIGLRINKQNK